jgi:hypothetical protein
MKSLLITSTFIISLIGCTSTQDTKQTTESIDQSNAIALYEESVPGTTKPEVRKVKIAKPGINPDTLINGVADVLVDGRLESDSLKKENPVHVLIDDAVEKTAELEDTEKNQSNKITMPK